MRSAISVTFVATIGSPERRIMSGRNSRMRWICSCGFRPSLAAMVSITMALAPRAARLALSGHLFDNATHHHLQSPTRGTCGDVDVATNGIAIGAGARGLDDASVFVHQFSARHFTNFSDRVDHANGDIREFSTVVGALLVGSDGTCRQAAR